MKMIFSTSSFITGVLLLIIRQNEVAASYSKVAATTSNVKLPTPSGYNFTDLVSQIFPEDVRENIQAACEHEDGKGAWVVSWPTTRYVGGGCEAALDYAEFAIKTFFQTSDLDNYNIFSSLFINRPYYPSMVQNIGVLARTLLLSNSSLFGDSSNGSPGLLKDTVTLMDGAQQIKATGAGQRQSVKLASKLSTTALKTLANEIKTHTTDELAPDLIDYMRQLAANRQAVQQDVFSQINDAVNTTRIDLENQNDELVNEYYQGYIDEQKRYNDFVSVVNDAIEMTKQDVNVINTRMANVTRYYPKFSKTWNTTQLANVKTVLTSAIQDLYSSQLTAAEAGIQGDIGNLASSIADVILGSRADFISSSTDIATDASNSLNTLANQILGSDKNLVTITDSSSRSSLDAAVKSIVAALNSLGLGAYNDALAALNKAKAIPGSITGVQAQIDKDVATLLAQVNTKDIPGLQTPVFFKQASVKRDFDKGAQGVSKSLTDTIAQKSASAKSMLQGILGAISSGASGTAGDQSLAGTSASDQAAAGATAAALTAARAQLAGDRAGSGLSTVAGVVSASLNDAMNTATDINNANAAAVTRASAQTSAAQQALIDASYAQLNAAASEASGVSQSLSSSFGEVSLAGAALNDALEADGQNLYFHINNQQANANGVFNDANDLYTGAQNQGNSLLGEMSGFENQAPQLVDATIKRITAIGNGIGSSGSSAQSSATGQAGADALNTLNQLTGYLGSVSSRSGPSTGTVAAQQGVNRDATALIGDVNNMPGSVAAQSAAAQALMKARANRAMSQSVAALSAASGDSNTALSSLMQFDADLVNSKRSTVLAGSKSVLDATLDAYKYVTDSGSNYYNASSDLISDAQSLGSAGSLNVSNVLTSLNDTLSDTTFLANRTISISGAKVVNATARFSNAVQSNTANILSQIAAKLADAQSTTSNAGGSLDPTAIQLAASQLNDYIGSLQSSFEVQRKAFNTNAQKYAVRRIAAITGLSEAVIAQKATVLAGLANADASQDTVASRTTNALQSLLQAVEKAKSQSGSGVSMSQVSQMIDGIGSGTNSLAASLGNQMRSDFAALGSNANNAAASAGAKLGGLVAGTATSAGNIGNGLANAIQLISQSDSAVTAAANGGQKDVYAIAGMLKNFDQATRAKISNMIKSVQSGNMTMAQAVNAARALQQTDITSVYDVVQSLSGYISHHEAMVNNFMTSLNASRDGIATAVKSAISDHEGIEGDIMADVANNTEQLANLHDNLLAVSLTSQTTPLQDSQAQMLKSVIDIEDRVGQILFGTTTPAPVAPSGLWFNSKSGQTEGSLAQIRAKDASPSDISFPDAINDLHSLLAQASGNLTTESASFKSEVDTEVQAATNLIQQIVQTVRTAVHI